MSTDTEPLATPRSHPRAPGVVVDIVLGVLVVATVFVPFPEQLLSSSAPSAIVSVCVAAVVLPLRRWWPVLVLVVCLLLFGAASLHGTLSLGIGLATATAMFSVTSRLSRRAGFLIAGVATVAIVVVSLPVTMGSVADPRAFQFALLMALAAAAGDGSRTRRDYIDAVTERAERAERTREAEAKRRVSEERLRIARDLHDAVAHQIAVISLNAGVASSAIETNPEKSTTALATIRGAAREVLTEIGDLLSMLRADDDSDVAATSPQFGLESLDDLIDQFTRSGLEVHVRVEGDIARAGGAIGMVGYRVVQEALTNAHKHGAEHRAHVLIQIEDELVTIVVANPMKIGPAPAAGGTGLGLIGLRERVASVRGAVHAGPVPGGWRVVAEMPLAKERETS